MRRYPMKNVLNMRDLGGYPTEGAGHTKYGRFIRSDAPVSLAPEELSRLLEMGLSTVVDLRGAQEAEVEPSAFLGCPQVEVISIPLDDGIPWPSREEDIPDCYLQMVERPVFLGVLRAMAEAPGAVLFHCAVGKDRTGVTAAALLSLCGVPPADIIADYQVSSTYLTTPAHGYTGHLNESKAAYMARLLEMIQARHGGMAQLLTKLGLTPAEQAALRGKLLAD